MVTLALLFAASGILAAALAAGLRHARRQRRLEAEAQRITQRMAAERARRLR